jgi:hypothetical protein
MVLMKKMNQKCTVKIKTHLHPAFQQQRLKNANEIWHGQLWKACQVKIHLKVQCQFINSENVIIASIILTLFKFSFIAIKDFIVAADAFKAREHGAVDIVKDFLQNGGTGREFLSLLDIPKIKTGNIVTVFISLEKLFER